MDWALFALPLAFDLKALQSWVPIVALGMIAVYTIIRRKQRFKVNLWPIALLLAATAVVVSRPSSPWYLITVVLVVVIVVMSMLTVSRQRMVASLVDGIGLTLVANVAAYLAGVQTVAQGSRVGGLVEETGFTRVFFPLSLGLNIPPILATLFLVGIVFLLRDGKWLRRGFRLLAITAAIAVLIMSGTRTPLVIAILLPLIALLWPSLSRRAGPALAILAALSALVLPALLDWLAPVLAPFADVTGSRGVSGSPIGSLNGRQYIWSQAIDYWSASSNSLADQLTGYGVNGQVTSGVSLTYYHILVGVTLNPESATLHNAFLQQLFDGGLLGWALMATSAILVTLRLAAGWRNGDVTAVAASLIAQALLVTSMTEAAMSVGTGQDGFAILLAITAAASQRGSTPKRPATSPRISRATSSVARRPARNVAHGTAVE